MSEEGSAPTDAADQDERAPVNFDFVMSKRRAMGLMVGLAVKSTGGVASSPMDTHIVGNMAGTPSGGALTLPSFPNVAAGMAATAAGQTFAVIAVSGPYAVVYERVDDRAEERVRYATAAAFAGDIGTSLLRYRAPFAGAQARSLADKLLDAPLNVLDFGVAPQNSGSENRIAFNRAIAAANMSGKMLYLPVGTYRNAGVLDTLTGPGIAGDAAGGAVIHHLTADSCLVTRGSYMRLANLTIINKAPPGLGNADSACFHIINCAYGAFVGLYSAHDLDRYSGIMLEQQYNGSADDAAFLTHLGCWYNHFTACAANYASLGSSHGYGIRFRVAPTATGVVDPPGQARGTYTGQCSYNVIDLPNIEQRVEGLRLEYGACNHVRGGQFLGCDTQVRLIDSSANMFLGTRHNQWRLAAFAEDGTSQRNVILYPSLFQLAPQPWSIGRLAATSVAIRNDQNGGWTPRLTFGGVPAHTTRASGSFVITGSVVEINWDIRIAAQPAGGVMEIGGLPFPAVNDPEEGLAICDLFVLDHGTGARTPAGRIGSGYCASTTITALADHTQDLTAAHFGSGAIILGKMTYFTRWN